MSSWCRWSDFCWRPASRRRTLAIVIIAVPDARCEARIRVRGCAGRDRERMRGRRQDHAQAGERQCNRVFDVGRLPRVGRTGPTICEGRQRGHTRARCRGSVHRVLPVGGCSDARGGAPGEERATAAGQPRQTRTRSRPVRGRTHIASAAPTAARLRGDDRTPFFGPRSVRVGGHRDESHSREPPLAGGRGSASGAPTPA